MTDLAPADTQPEDDLNCPVCDYALHGLPNPRCPECGYAFEWAELREQARRRQLWFYEHSGTFKAFRQTRWRSLRPWLFWSQIHAYSDASAKRLMLYGVVTLLLTAAVGGTLTLLWPAVYDWMPALRRWLSYQYPALRYGSYSYLPSYRVPAAPATPWYGMTAWRVIWFFNNASFRDTRPLVNATAMAGVWVLGMAAYFKLLTGSVLRARIRPIHLARVTAYSADVLPVLLVLFAVSIVVLPPLLPRSVASITTPFYVNLFLHAAVFPMAMIVPLTLRMHGALRRYVRFPQASGVAIGFAVIVTLIWAILSVQTMATRWR